MARRPGRPMGGGWRLTACAAATWTCGCWTSSGGEPINLTAESASGECDPVWSPDGTQIAFTSWRYGDKDLFRLRPGERRGAPVDLVSERGALYGWDGEGELLYMVSTASRQDVYAPAPSNWTPEDRGRRLTRWRVRRRAACAPAREWRALAFLYRARTGRGSMLEHPEDRRPAPAADGRDGRRRAAGVDGRTAAWREAQGEPVVLYTEQTTPGEDAPYDLKRLEGITVGNAWLSDRVDDSFVALRAGDRREGARLFVPS